MYVFKHRSGYDHVGFAFHSGQAIRVYDIANSLGIESPVWGIEINKTLLKAFALIIRQHLLQASDDVDAFGVEMH